MDHGPFLFSQTGIAGVESHHPSMEVVVKETHIRPPTNAHEVLNTNLWWASQYIGGNSGFAKDIAHDLTKQGVQQISNIWDETSQRSSHGKPLRNRLKHPPFMAPPIVPWLRMCPRLGYSCFATTIAVFDPAIGSAFSKTLPPALPPGWRKLISASNRSLLPPSRISLCRTAHLCTRSALPRNSSSVDAGQKMWSTARQHTLAAFKGSVFLNFLGARMLHHAFCMLIFSQALISTRRDGFGETKPLSLLTMPS